jgi:acetyl-CoA acyltransferase
MKAHIVGVGMTKFEKPGTRDWQYWDMVREAGTAALDDAGVRYDQVEQVPVGYCFQASTAGQRAVYELGLTGVPVYNVNNNCATGSTALMLARQFVEGGGDFASSPVARH